VAKATVGKSVGVLVQQILETHPAFSANPIGDWQELVGEQVALNSQPKSLKNKKLEVIVYDSIWKHHLELNKELIMERINQGRPEPLVEKMLIRVGEIPESPPELNLHHKKLGKIKSKHHRSKKKKAPRRSLTKEEKALLRQLPDPELRAIGARLFKLIPSEQED
jgi:hypothetical protein